MMVMKRKTTFIHVMEACNQISFYGKKHQMNDNTNCYGDAILISFKSNANHNRITWVNQKI